jgi:hypothetical protein
MAEGCKLRVFPSVFRGDGEMGEGEKFYISDYEDH